MAKTNLDYVSILGKDSVVSNGSITVPSHFKISGVVKMNINSAGKVVISKSGVVEGYIRATDVQISGRVTGDVIAARGLTIHNGGVVEGRMAAVTLHMEEGARCNAEMAVGEEAKARRKTEFENETKGGDGIGPPKDGKGQKQSQTSQIEDDSKGTAKKALSEERDNGKKSEKDQGAPAPVDKEKASTNIEKVGDDLPSNKDWVDRFW